jgi:tRNA A-37 threonylcarbamoyl transferase component Bud32
MSDLTGLKIANQRYEILEFIASGGMAAVYKGRDLKLDRDVAVKIIREKFTNSPDMRERFEKEAKIMADLGSHPNILEVYDYGYDETIGSSGQHYIIMQFVEGGTLADCLGQPIELSTAVKFVDMIANGLAYAHSHKGKVLHRDIKPGNLLIKQESGRDRVLISDFGIAKFLINTQQTSQSEDNTLIGSHGYMAPEQRSKSAKLDTYTDIYALGLVALEMLTGRSLVYETMIYKEGGRYINVSAMLEILPSEIPPAIALIIEKAIAPDPKDRYTDVLSFTNDLNRTLKEILRKSEESQRDADLLRKEIIDRRTSWLQMMHHFDAVAQKKDEEDLDFQIFQFYGVAGIGKTELLKALSKRCGEFGIQHSYIDLADYSTSTAQIAFVEHLISQLSDTRKFHARITKRIEQFLEGTKAQREDRPFSSRRNNGIDEEEIWELFHRYLLTLLDDKPIILFFDSSEQRLPKIRPWLEKLYDDAQSTLQPLTLVLGGRDYVRWKSGIMGETQHHWELKPFDQQDTRKQWELHSSIDPAQLEEWSIFSNYSHGHPAVNLCIIEKLEQLNEQNKISGNSKWWEEIVQHVAKHTLNSLIGEDENSIHLKLKESMCILAPFRTFDRRAARAMFQELRPDLMPDAVALQNRLTTLLSLSVLEKKKVGDLFYQMQAYNRRFIVEDLRMHESNTYKKAHEIAFEHYNARISEPDQAAFHFIVPEMLYHQAILCKLSKEADSSQPEESIALEEDDIKVLTERLKKGLDNFHDRASGDSYIDMHKRLSNALKKDEDEEFEAIVGNECFTALTNTLEAYLPYPQMAIPDSPSVTTLNDKRELEMDSSSSAPEKTSSLRPSPLKDLSVVASITIITLLVLSFVAGWTENLNHLAILLPVWIILSILIVIVYFGATGRLDSDNIVDLLSQLIARSEKPQHISESQSEQDKDIEVVSANDETSTP